jgi:probable phosphoglycerate mutase
MKDCPIYVTLHGETEWNQQGRVQGQLDSALTEVGLGQARRAGATLRRLLGKCADFLIVSSPLGRAIETGQHICRAFDLDAIRMDIDSRLAEINLGSWSGRSRDQVEKHWPDLVEGAGRHGWYFRSPDGERFEDLAKRLAEWLAEAKDRNVITLAVTHGIASRVLRGLYAGLPREKTISLENDRNVIFRLHGGRVDHVPYD